MPDYFRYFRKRCAWCNPAVEDVGAVIDEKNVCGPCAESGLDPALPYYGTALDGNDMHRSTCPRYQGKRDCSCEEYQPAPGGKVVSRG